MKRFWEKVNKTNKCWNWVGGLRGKTGYGCIKYKGKVIDTHRFSWTLAYGEIPQGLLVCHHCDNRICVRPDHLFLGTYKNNYDDAFQKGHIKYKPSKYKSYKEKRQVFRPKELSYYHRIGKWLRMKRLYLASNSMVE